MEKIGVRDDGVLLERRAGRRALQFYYGILGPVERLVFSAVVSLRLISKFLWMI